MGASHHGSVGPEEDRIRQEQLKKLMERFVAQAEGNAKREYSSGRISATDDGDLAMAITADLAHKTVIIRFGKPIEWLGLGEKETRGLIQLLIGKLREIATEPFSIEV